MSEASAAEILLAQLDLDVAEAKQALLRAWSYSDDGAELASLDAFEQLAERVCVRWWVKRMANHRKPIDAEAAAERGQRRAKVLAACVQGMIDHSGPIEINALQMSALALSSDINALWGCLIEAGMVTPELRQEYMDASVENTYQRVQDYAQKIVVANAPTSGRRQ